MFEAAISGARTDEIEGVDVVIRPALTAAAIDVLEADGYLLGTPVHIMPDTRLWRVVLVTIAASTVPGIRAAGRAGWSSELHPIPEGFAPRG